MATGTICVVCKARPPEDQVSVGFTQLGDSVALYRHRLGEVLELELRDHDLSGRCLCVRCESRLNKIEQLRKMQEVFKQEFISSEPRVSAGHSGQPDEEIPKVFDKQHMPEILCTDPRHSRTETGATSGAVSQGHASKKPVGASSTETYCGICNTTLATLRGLRLHQRIHEDSASKLCKVCGRAFTSASSLTLHIQQEHGALRLHRCQLCSYTSTSPASMRTHTKRKHPDKKPDFINLLSDIPEWPESQVAVARLQRESLTTLPRRSNRKQGYKCMKCTSTFAEVAALKEHMMSDHCSPSVGRENNKEGHKSGTSVLERDKESKIDANHSEVVLTIKQELPMCVNDDVCSVDPSDDMHSSKNGDISDSSVAEDSEVFNHPYECESNQRNPLQTVKEHSRVSDVATKHLHKDETSVNSHDVKVYESNYRPQCSAQEIKVPGDAVKKSKKGKRCHTAVCCPHCTRTFRHEAERVDHIRDHTEGKILQCSVCQMGFKQQASLHTHMLKHSGLYPHCCPDCGKGFAHAWALRNHAGVHSKATPYQCRHCPVRFPTLHQRRMHCRRQHLQKQEEAMKVSKKDTTFTCPTCDKSFCRKLNLTAHLETHNITKTAECQLCMKKFKGKSQLASHMYWHTLQLKKVKGQKFLCEECGKSYKNMKGLRDHIRCHRGDRTFSCTICQLVVPNQSRLQKHMETVHSVEKPYKCDLCDKSFVYKISYDAHCNMHKDLRPFLCSTCGKGFRTRPHLKEHMNVHSQTKSFLCNQCSATFMWRAQLIRHKNSVHADPSIPKAPTVKRGPRKKPANHGQASESCPGLATLEAMSTAPLDHSVTVSPLEPAVTVTPLEPAVRVNPLEPDVRVSPLVIEPPMMVRPIEHTLTIRNETDNTEPPHPPTGATLTGQVTEDNQVMLPPDSASTFIQLNGSMVRGQLLQNMPIQAFLQQHQAVASRTTYVIRPSHMGLVAEVVPDGQHLQQQQHQQQQQEHNQQPQLELQQHELQQQCYQPQQQQ